MEGSNPDEDTLSTSFEGTTRTLYKRRWFILALLSLLQTSNAIIWLSFAPIADHTAHFYNTIPDTVNYLSLVYMVVSAVFGAGSAYLLDKLGLRTGIIIGAWLNFLGAGIKLLSTYPSVFPEYTSGSTNWSLIVVFIGQSVAAFAQPYLMFAPTKLAALWFQEEMRAVANTIGSMANPLGIVIGSVLAPALVNPPSGASDLTSYFQLLMGVHVIPAGIAAVLSVIVITASRPPTPPSASAAEDEVPFGVAVRKIFRNKNYWILMISCGAGISLFTVLTSLLQQMLCPYGYSDSFAGMVGALMVASGIVGAGITGVIADKTRRFEEIAKTCYCFAVVAGAMFTIVCRYPNQQVLITLTLCLFGMFGFGLYPICLELGVEVTYPVPEATSSGFIIISGQIQGILYLVIMQEMLTPINTTESVCSTAVVAKDFTYANIFFTVMAFLVASLLIIFFRANYKRMRAEQEAAAQRILGFTSSSPSALDN